MIDIECIELEDGKEYIIVSRKKYNGVEYLYLSSKKDDDICIRKIKGDYIVPLDNEDELVEVIKLFD